MVLNRRGRYSPEAYIRYRRHLGGALRFGARWFGSLGAILALSVFLLPRGDVFVWIAAITSAVGAFGLVVAIFRLVDLGFPQLMPYFSTPVPGSGLMIGYKLLKHSRRLDDLAEAIGLRRIGSFVSDDDLFDGYGPTWHSAAEALATFEGLLHHFAADAGLQAARPDLEHLRDRLRLAVTAGTQFCLLLRDVHATNAREWGQRKGYC